MLTWDGTERTRTTAPPAPIPEFGTAGVQHSDRERPGQYPLGTRSNWPSLPTNPNIHLRWRDYEFYAADNWKIRRNLTIDSVYGTRCWPRRSRPITSSPASVQTFGARLSSTNRLCGSVQRSHRRSRHRPCQAPTRSSVRTSRLPVRSEQVPEIPTTTWSPRVSASRGTRRAMATWQSALGSVSSSSATAPPRLRECQQRSVRGEQHLYPNTGCASRQALLGGAASPAGGYDPSSQVSNSLQWNLAVRIRSDLPREKHHHRSRVRWATTPSTS